MDGRSTPISPDDLYARLGTASAPVLIDIRHLEAFAADDALIVGAIRRAPDAISHWQHALPQRRLIVVYCAHGQEVGQNAAATLAAAGMDAAYLAGGIAGWRQQHLPTRRKSEQAITNGSPASGRRSTASPAPG